MESYEEECVHTGFSNEDIAARLDRIDKNINALGGSVNSVVDTVNGFMDSVKGFMESGGLSRVMGMLGTRSDG